MSIPRTRAEVVRLLGPLVVTFLLMPVIGVALFLASHQVASKVFVVSRTSGLDAGPESYRFEKIQPGTRDVPVTYDRCRALHYVVNFDGAPATDPGASFVFSAIHRISDATGLRFDYDGPSSEGPRWGEAYRGGAIHIGFATPTQVSGLEGRTVGWGGSVAVPARGRLEQYVSGDISLDRQQLASIIRRRDGEGRARAIVLHELGHVVGLAHVNDPRQVMFTDGPGPDDLNAGDRRGLEILGSEPCY